MKAQSFERTVVSSSGDFYSQNYLSLSQTIGELPIIDEYISSSLLFSNGFQYADESKFKEIPFFVRIYPIPASKELFVEYNDNTINELSIFNTLGQSIQKVNIVPYLRNTINILNLTSGIYFVELYRNKKVAVIRKLIVTNF